MKKRYFISFEYQSGTMTLVEHIILDLTEEDTLNTTAVEKKIVSSHPSFNMDDLVEVNVVAMNLL